MLTRFLLAATFIAATATAAAAQTTYLIVRHAERADAGTGGMGAGGTANDPGLSPEGRARATSLAEILKVSKLTAVFTTEFKRTQETAQPAAAAHGLTPTVVDAQQTAALVQKLAAATGAVLVVGHSNTVPEVIAALGITDKVIVPDTEFDNLFIVVSGPRPTLIRLKYK
jgi:broad specificity phosphatase PhoE